ncbi:MAG: putative exported protein [Pedosphaera sp.]|nr:putative exported protein [Pedosphaera sp.]
MNFPGRLNRLTILSARMKTTPKQHLSYCILISALTASCALADSQSGPAASEGSFSVDDNFRTGWHEATFGSTALFSNIRRRGDRPNVNYVLGYAQVAYAVTAPGDDGFFRGSFQLAPEAFAGGIYSGPGSYLAGGTLWFRYNFVQRGWKVVPYIEGGGGGTAIDLPHKYDGKDFNFNLDLGAGVRWFIEPRCSLNLEYRFQHISNANLWDHNAGVNTTGPSVGVSFFF